MYGFFVDDRVRFVLFVHGVVLLVIVEEQK
jgi:hypothetical protein